MNFHKTQAPVGAAPGAELRYRAPTREQIPATNEVKRRVLAALAAPLSGSRFVFPRRFGAALRRLQDDPEAGDVPPEDAIWFFGPRLHLEIDPARLTHRIHDYVLDRHGVRWMGRSFLDAADWSEVTAPLEKSPIHREMSELVAAGDDYRDTRAYRNLVLAIESGRPCRRNAMRLATIEDIESYIRYCRALIESVRTRGVLRRGLAGGFHRLRLKHRESRSPMLDSAERDIGVAITADGKLIRHLGGKHRTAIARALDLPVLPVEVRLVHVRWLAKEMDRTGLPAHRALIEGIDAVARQA
jgi:hypothetical protein